MLYSYSTAVIVGVAGLFIWLVIARVRTYRRLSHIPGPFWTGWTDLWLISAQLSGRISFVLADANTKYGRTSISLTGLLCSIHPDTVAKLR